jgi:hypothetical protein
METPEPRTINTINPYAFTVGYPRSGSSLLKRMRNAHLPIAVFGESHWIGPLFEEQRGLTPQGLVTPELTRESRPLVTDDTFVGVPEKELE